MVSESAITATKKAARALESLGHRVHEITYQPLNGIEAMQSYYIMNSVETAAMFDGIKAGLGRQMALEDMELMTWAIFQSGQKIPAKVYSKVLTQWDSLDWTPFTQQANLTGQPSISLPVYRDGQGLSLGVQLTAAKGREDLLLHLAQQMEEGSVFS